MAQAKESEQKLIKSRKRVRDHGEVFTPDWLVRDMCDLVAAQCADVGTRFLEPACGDGNFLVEILRRKLAAARALVGGRTDTARFRREAFRALSSLYGIDILSDNVSACRANLLQVWTESHDAKLRHGVRWAGCEQSARFVLQWNILHGNTLEPDGSEETPAVVFVEWQWEGDVVRGTEERLSALLQESDADSLFAVHDCGNAIGPLPYWQLGGELPAPEKAAPAEPSSPPKLRRFENGMAEFRADGSYQFLLAL